MEPKHLAAAAPSAALRPVAAAPAVAATAPVVAVVAPAAAVTAGLGGGSGAPELPETCQKLARR